jgi:hypothetical protein
MECCLSLCDKYNTESDDEIETHEYSLVSLSHKDVAQLKVIGELYIHKRRYHAFNDCIYDDTQTKVGRIIEQNIIAWY